MNKITERAKDRIAHTGLQEQLEDARRQMQRECGTNDMGDVDAHLKHDRMVLPIDGAD